MYTTQEPANRVKKACHQWPDLLLCPRQSVPGQAQPWWGLLGLFAKYSRFHPVLDSGEAATVKLVYCEDRNHVDQ